MASTRTTTHRPVPAGRLVRAHRVRPGAGARRRRPGARPLCLGALRRGARRAQRSASGRRARRRSSIASRSNSTARSASSRSAAAAKRRARSPRSSRPIPTYLPGEAEASPRVRAAFSDVRQRLLPEIAPRRYARGQGDVRSQGLRDRGAAVPPGARAARRSRHGRQAARPAHAVSGLPRSVGRGVDAAARAAQAGGRRAARRRRAGRRSRIRIASTRWLDKDVTPPVVIRQEMPRLTPIDEARRRRTRGVVEVVIDEQGRVTVRRDPRVGAPDVRRRAAVGGARLALSAGDADGQARPLPQDDPDQRQSQH